MQNFSTSIQFCFRFIACFWPLQSPLKSLTIKVQVHVNENNLFQFRESFPVKRRDVEKVLIIPGTNKKSWKKLKMVKSHLLSGTFVFNRFAPSISFLSTWFRKMALKDKIGWTKTLAYFYISQHNQCKNQKQRKTSVSLVVIPPWPG